MRSLSCVPLSLTGRKAQLARRSGKLFTHVSSVLKRHNMLTTAIGTDYNLILRQHLLAPGSDYPATSHSAVFQGELASQVSTSIHTRESLSMTLKIPKSEQLAW